ncbi:MAG: pyridoxal phosphate-dependent aminotransferase [bacterium]
MQEKISEKACSVKPFLVMEIMEKAEAMERRGEGIVHLEVGEPDFSTPEPVVEAAIKAIKDGRTHYTHSLGILELREAIAEHYCDKYGVNISPDNIVVTNGTSPAMSLAFCALLSDGDEVILTDPHYACYPNFIRVADGRVKSLPVREEDAFQFTAEQVEEFITPAQRAVVVNSPSNPTGTLIRREVMEKIAERGIFVVSDEIYHGLVYGEKEHTILEFTDRSFVINGFSKLYAMTGWRIGYLIAPSGFIRTLQSLHQNFFIAANTFVQWAAIAALRRCRSDVEAMVGTYDQRRKCILEELKSLGFSVKVEPKGAFYVLAGASHISRNSYQLAHEILEKAKVAVTPGIDFGDNGEGYLRFSYANSIDNIREGARRIKAFLDERQAM